MNADETYKNIIAKTLRNTNEIFPLPNRDRRAAEEAARKAQEGRWTFDRLWEEWKKANGSKPSRVNDDNRYKNHLKDPFGDKEPRELVPLDVDRLRVRLLNASAPPPGPQGKADVRGGAPCWDSTSRTPR
jgi:hypothetical protein